MPTKPPRTGWQVFAVIGLLQVATTTIDLATDPGLLKVLAAAETLLNYWPQFLKMEIGNRVRELGREINLELWWERREKKVQLKGSFPPQVTELRECDPGRSGQSLENLLLC